MHSESYRALHRRIRDLKRRYLPPTKPNGLYTEPEQDQLRALRMLAHAEIEQFLENYSELIANDLKSQLGSSIRRNSLPRIWASSAVKQTLQAISQNNGITRESIQKLFEPLGVTDEDCDRISPIFLDRISTFGRNRGDVAHRSAIGATLQLNKIREEKFLDEIMGYLEDFDFLLIQKRLAGFDL